jgi:hypothetical protein
MGALFVGGRFFRMLAEIDGPLAAITLVLCIISDVVQHRPD